MLSACVVFEFSFREKNFKTSVFATLGVSRKAAKAQSGREEYGCWLILGKRKIAELFLLVFFACLGVLASLREAFHVCKQRRASSLLLRPHQSQRSDAEVGR